MSTYVASGTGTTQADFSYCGGYKDVCATTSCCIYVSSTSCGPRISVNSQICVPKANEVAKGDMIGLNAMSANRISIADKTAYTASPTTAPLPKVVYAAQACGNSYYMA